MLLRPQPASTALEPAGPPPLELLGPFERFTFRLVDHLARNGVRATEVYLRTLGDAWMWRIIDRILVVRGLDRVADLPTDAPIVMAANHRTYFDLYLISVILNRFTRLHQPVFCPVRSDFFYQSPIGLAVNLFAGGGRMYPPVFRDPPKSDFNKWSLARLVELIRRGNVLIGFHPEGTRNKDPDPYAPLPAQPGLGKLVMETWPVVVPVFVNGLTNNLPAVFRANRRRVGHVTCVFGEPVDLSAFRTKGNRLATHKRIADTVLAAIYALGEEDRRLREELAAGR